MNGDVEGIKGLFFLFFFLFRKVYYVQAINAAATPLMVMIMCSLSLSVSDKQNRLLWHKLKTMIAYQKKKL